MAEYTFKPVETSDADIDALLGLFAASYPKATKFSREYVTWQYCDNPVGKVVGFNAWDGDGLVAHYATMPIYMMIDGKKELGLLSLNTATHPEHQGRRLFTKLADMTYNFAAEQGYKYVIGVANANSTHGFLKHLGFKLICPLKFKVGIGNSIFENRELTFSRYWDKELLEWRTKNPSENYYQNGNLLVGPIAPMFKKIIHAHSDLNLPKYSWHPFNLYVGLGANLKKGIYCGVPKFIERSPFNLIWRDLTNGTLPEMNPDNVFFELIDFDVA